MRDEVLMRSGFFRRRKLALKVASEHSRTSDIENP